MIAYLLAIFGVALIGLLGSTACWLFLRFSVAEPYGPLLAFLAWIAGLVGTGLFIIDLTMSWQSVG